MEKSARVEIARIPKGNGRAGIRVALDQMGTRRLIDVRLWFRPPQLVDDAPMIPTRKGITIAPETAAAVAAAINQAVAEAARETGEGAP